ncbi:MAG: glycosyltransferase family 39 protein [Nanoarchaeota archaeon]|nr:glycosyltransferase family 39 protein [Nanoarchaeota archaeon]
MLIFLIALYKAIFFPIVTDDAVNIYAFISEKAWIDGFPPISSSSFMQVSYAWPNTNFVLFLHNYFFGINFGFDDLFMKILIPIFALLNLLIIYNISIQLFNNKTIAQLSVAIFLSSIIFSPLIIQTQTTVYELLFPLLAIYAFILYSQNKDYKLLILTGIFLGVTLMMKYTLIPFVLLFLFAIFLFKRNWKTPLKIALIAFPVSAIFYLRNLIVYKNPFFPYFFGGNNYDEFTFKIQQAWAYAPQYNLNQFLVILVPISIFIFLFFTLFLIDYIKRKKKNELFNILIFTSVSYFVFWFLTSAFITEAQGTRHLVHSFALISIFASAYLIEKIESRKIQLWVALFPIISISLIYLAYFLYVSDPYFEYSKNLLILLLIQPILLSCVLVLSKFKINKKTILALLLISLFIVPLGFSAFAKRTAPWEFPTKEEVVRRYYPEYFEAFEFINNNLSNDAKILAFYNQRYYIKKEIFPADSPKVSFLYTNISLDDALEKLREQKIDYIMINEIERIMPYWNISLIHKAHSKNELNLLILYKNNEVTIYEI